MVRRFGRPTWHIIAAAVAALAIAMPAAAQSTGMVKGVVRDDKGQPVEGAVVTIESVANARRFQTKTNRRGEYVQIGLNSGQYKVSAEKDKLASATSTVGVRVGAAGDTDLVIGLAAAAASGDAQAKMAALTKVLDEAVAASNAGRHDEAIEKFNQGIAVNPQCSECYRLIGHSYMQKKDYEQSEVAYKKAIELKGDSAESYSGLASLYNAQRRFDDAAVASAKATELSTSLSATGGAGAGADAMYNQGVILWNSGKIAEAKKQFEAAVQSNPNHAEAHYQLGMALVNEGNLAGAASAFETYLKLTPDGPNAATAKSLVAQLKK
jgi:cytochrome c-type biogenesis protein CcmH/NrfG